MPKRGTENAEDPQSEEAVLYAEVLWPEPTSTIETVHQWVVVHCYKTTILCYRNIRHFPHCYKIIRQLTQYYKIITAAQFVHLQQAQILISDRLKVDNSIL